MVVDYPDVYTVKCSSVELEHYLRGRSLIP
jgi:hypothetical protein